jgi:CHAT domain-containing protein
MHALIDDENPMYSRLVFTQGIDTLEDGNLHTFELYNMKLNHDLAVLSACNTGYGKLQKGEGIMSLARAFSYAGVPSVVTSQWQVNDQSSFELMDLFYEYLTKGLSKDEALQKAKIDYLQNTNGLTAHPYFWATHILIGDTTPIQSSKSNALYYVLILGVMALAGVIYKNLKR